MTTLTEAYKSAAKVNRVLKKGALTPEKTRAARRIAIDHFAQLTGLKQVRENLKLRFSGKWQAQRE